MKAFFVSSDWRRFSVMALKAWPRLSSSEISVDVETACVRSPFETAVAAPANSSRGAVILRASTRPAIPASRIAITAIPSSCRIRFAGRPPDGKGVAM
jgi:hypothetical protein